MQSNEAMQSPYYRWKGQMVNGLTLVQSTRLVPVYEKCHTQTWDILTIVSFIYNTQFWTEQMLKDSSIVLADLTSMTNTLLTTHDA